MNRIRNLIVLTCAAMFPHVAAAFILDPCSDAGTANILSGGPGPNDPLGLILVVPATIPGLYTYPQYTYYWLKVSPGIGNTFVADLILTDDTKTFPGYTLVDQNAQYWEILGPLPVGAYTILGTVNVYDPTTGMIHPECDPVNFPPLQKATLFGVFALTDPVYQTFRQVEAPVVEYYNPALDDYFMTMDPAEIDALARNSGFPSSWERTYYQFFAYMPPSFSGSSTNVRRYYLAGRGSSHFFTFDNAEAASLSSAWVLENDAAFAIWEPNRATGVCPPNTLPVYRLANGSKHRYTINTFVRADMIAKGWIPEGYGPDGVVMCSPGA